MVDVDYHVVDISDDGNMIFDKELLEDNMEKDETSFVLDQEFVKSRSNTEISLKKEDQDQGGSCAKISD